MFGHVILLLIVVFMPLALYFRNKNEAKKREKYVGVSFMDSESDYKIKSKKQGKKVYYYPTFYKLETGHTPFVDKATDRSIKFSKETEVFEFISEYIDWKFRERELHRQRSEANLHLYMITVVLSAFMLL